MNHGICHLSIVPIRASAGDANEMVTQLLFGETFIIVERQKKWTFIQTTYDHYTGWIDNKQYYLLSEIEYQQIAQHPTSIASEVAQLLVTNGRVLSPLVLGSSLPGINNKVFSIGVNTYIFEGEFISPKMPSLKNIKEFCLSYLNAPYLWGGRSPFGIDCSGFSQMVYKLCGYALPRDAWQQAELGEVVNWVHDIKIGDLLFFQNEDQKKISHVGIALANNKIIHASGQVRIDSIDHNGIYNLDSNTYTHKLRLIKRYINS